MNTIRASLMACAALGAMCATGAQAAVDEYSVEAGGRVTINVNLCSVESQLAVRGDTGTDLDFFLSDATGTVIHSDEGLDDYISVVVEKNGEECAAYSLVVANLGEENNDFTVFVEPIREHSVRIHKYIVGPGATQTVNFKACGTSAQVTARGDGDTDLDFIIRNSDGAVVHENDDLSDETTAQLEGLLSDCETFEMDVANLGEVYNALMVVVEPEGVAGAAFGGVPPTTSLASSTNATGGRTATIAETEGAGEYRAEANASIQVNLPVCGITRLEVRGDGDTDLDFTVTNEAGIAIHSDIDLSDVTFATLEPSDECETFAMVVDNLGGIYNVFNVALIDPETREGTAGPGEYRVNASLSTKVALRVCSTTNVRARGDGDTDLDFLVTDAQGATVHQDFDLTDRTEFTLEPGGDGCADFQMKVDNLGEVYNMLTVDFGGSTEASAGSGQADGAGDFVARVQRPQSAIATPEPPVGYARPDTISPDGSNRNVSIVNRTGETIRAIFWSNSATLEWGDDKLGEGQSLAQGQQWNVNVFDGSNACLFDFRAVTEGKRQIEVPSINICVETDVVIE